MVGVDVEVLGLVLGVVEGVCGGGVVCGYGGRVFGFGGHSDGVLPFIELLLMQ